MNQDTPQGAVMQAILAKLIAIDNRAARTETRLMVLAAALGHSDKFTPKEPDRKGTV